VLLLQWQQQACMQFEKPSGKKPPSFARANTHLLLQRREEACSLKSRREKSRLQGTRTFFCKKDNKHGKAVKIVDFNSFSYTNIELKNKKK